MEPPIRQPPVQWQQGGTDQPQRCRDCGYPLTGLGVAGACPECGREFDLANPATYTIKPPLLRWRLWLPGLALAGAGAFASVILTVLAGNWGWAIWFALPFAAGSLLGYRVRSRWFVLPLLGLALTIAMCFGLMAMDLAGVFCGMALAGIFIGPVLVGATLGTVLRMSLKRTRFSQRWHLPALLLWSLPIICGLIEGRPRQDRDIESVSTSLVIGAPVDVAWNSLMFYEQVRHEPPLILKIGLARPLHASDGAWQIGQRRTCIYNKGKLVKQITQSQPSSRLAFDVVEQRIGYEHDVRLTGGEFVFESAGPERTRVTLVTSYRPLLGPRWCWRPFERHAVHTLHRFVLDGIRLEARDRASFTGTLAAAETENGHLH